ncbi:MAG TPA: ATP-binding protein [Candidatus Elarobacter sp.]
MNPRTLRGQLALAYAGLFLIVLIAFSAVTLALVDSIGRSSLDERLLTAGRAVAAIVDERHGRVTIEDKDREQFERIAAGRLDAAVFDPFGGLVLSTVVAVPPEIAAVADGPPGLTTVRAAGASLRVARVWAPPRGGHGRILVWRDLDAVEELDRRLAVTFAIAIPIVALIAVAAGSAVAARGLRPLVALAELASEIEAHDLSRRIAIPQRDDELGRLCATFDRMLDRLEEAFARERRFTADASHELRAPLSVIRAEADLMLRRARTPEEYQRALRSIAMQADELETLTRDLLAAARGDANAGDPAATDLGAAAAAAADQLAPLAAMQHVTVRREIGADAPVRGDAAALRRVVVALLDNAIRHARPNGTVEVQVARADGTVRLCVADDGAGFTAEALAHATERFWRDDPARTRTGTGLGLSIADAIVRAAGGRLVLSNSPDGGALVAAEFPVLDSFM